MTVSATDVVLTVRGDRWRHPVGPGDQRTADLLWRLRGDPSSDLSYEIGAALGHRFLDAPGAALRAELARPGRHRLAIEVTDPALADLPWETLVPPGEDLPLALRPDVDVCRTGPDTPVPEVRVDGPLRMLAAIASPDDSTQPLLDHERELGRILGAVEPGHKHGYGCVSWSGAAPPRSGPPSPRSRFTCCTSPATRARRAAAGDPAGTEDRVDAARFLAEVLPPGRTVPLIVLAGCSTARQGQQELPGLAGALLAQGAPAVLAMNGTVSDGYVIEFCARLYERLAAQREPELLAEVSAVRRELAPTAAEWWMPTLFLADLALRLTGGRDGVTVAAPPGQSVVGDGVVRAPRISWAVGDPAPAVRDRLRVLVHGIGGIGKTSLAAELGQRFRAAGGIVVATSGDATADGILDELRHQVEAHCSQPATAPDDPLRQFLVALAQPGHDWRRRLAASGTGGTPLLLVLDNAEDALDAEHRLVDADLAAFLADWASRHELVVTSRHPFPVVGGDLPPRSALLAGNPQAAVAAAGRRPADSGGTAADVAPVGRPPARAGIPRRPAARRRHPIRRGDQPTGRDRRRPGGRVGGDRHAAGRGGRAGRRGRAAAPAARPPGGRPGGPPLVARRGGVPDPGGPDRTRLAARRPGGRRRPTAGAGGAGRVGRDAVTPGAARPGYRGLPGAPVDGGEPAADRRPRRRGRVAPQGGPLLGLAGPVHGPAHLHPAGRRGAVPPPGRG
ncbi:CHAT domain-containing protein [Micromonospora sp. M12]